MVVAPISNLVYHIPRAAFDDDSKTTIGIDRGCSLTKAAYLPKNDEGNTATHYSLHCILFNNSDFEDCLYFLKDNALLLHTGCVRITGTGCDKHRDVIHQILGVEVEFIDEVLTVIRGVHFLLTQVEDRDTLFFPSPPVDASLRMRPTSVKKVKWEQTFETLDDKGESSDDLFPCIFVLYGSTAAALLIEKDGTAKFTAMSMIAGKTMLGMGRVMSGVSNYDELMEMAASGSCANVDNIVEDYISNAPDSPYSRFPRQLPMYPFGKLVDKKSNTEDHRREDLAASIVRMMAMNLVSFFVSAIKQEGVSRVVIGGHGILGEPMRANVFQFLNIFMDIPLNPKCLKTGATGAIGAMIASVNDFQKVKG